MSTGSWVRRGPEIAAFSGGTAESADVSGATARLTFTGTAVTWIGLKCNICGVATVSIDGAQTGTVDTAGTAAPGSAGLAAEPVFTASGLAAGSHTLVIAVTGNTTSGGAHVIVDAFDTSAGASNDAGAAGGGGSTDPVVLAPDGGGGATDPATLASLAALLWAGLLVGGSRRRPRH